MAYYDSKKNKIVKFSPTPCPNYPGWEIIDCGCCGGIQWGGEEPRECERCGGSGTIAHHIKSDVYALYPGGEFI